MRDRQPVQAQLIHSLSTSSLSQYQHRPSPDVFGRSHTGQPQPVRAQPQKYSQHQIRVAQTLKEQLLLHQMTQQIAPQVLSDFMRSELVCRDPGVSLLASKRGIIQGGLQSCVCDPLSTASSTESLRRWWPFATRSSTYPKTQDELQPISLGFAGLARHRAFFKATGGQCYRNRKFFSSINLQAVCDHQGRFIDTYVGWPGSVHDSRVLRYSPLYRSSLYPPSGHFIFADRGYPCLQHPLPLITPYKRPIQGVGAQRFNSHHSRARSIIERAFGMTKTRFRAIFLQALDVHHIFVPHHVPSSPTSILGLVTLWGRTVWRPSVVLPDHCLQRCLPWRRCSLTTNIFNSDMAAVN
ncbi:uncharacterized protein LOC123986060 [Micropterus dolomieu]|uniref:uncharacterized protein LOC123986060 n=1 Tax=Micropterus dolomieu TaxID=147949 RepID=UPI001E8DA14C|nr:uncharacterized protein LOC123986060 [Micropterus dolomieu]